MARSLVLLIYNIVLPVFFVIVFPAWVIKMWRRGGYGTGLLERFGVFKADRNSEPQGVVYIHAVSVGEVLLALKLAQAIDERWEGRRVVVAATTSTGHAVAKNKAPASVRVIYSPLDFNFIVRRVLRRFSPEIIVLIEAEAWPNMLRIAQKKSIPVVIANARLSVRSEARFRQFSLLIKPIFEMVTRMGVQEQSDKRRFEALGIDPQKIHLTGSIKFDPAGGGVPSKRAEFSRILDDFGLGRPVVLLASTHAGEEGLLARAVRESGCDVRLVVVPRHAERRVEVISDLKQSGYGAVLRTAYQATELDENKCLVIDTTGELRDWTAHADIVVIGKSWLGEGGQNPAEAIAAGVPVICGPKMGNFQPLVSQLVDRDAVLLVENVDELKRSLRECLGDLSLAKERSERAREVLSQHAEALQKTLELL